MDEKTPRSKNILAELFGAVGGLAGLVSGLRFVPQALRTAVKEASAADATHPTQELELGTEAQTKRPEPAANQDAETPLLPGWNRPKPQKLPVPTYWPAVLAFGVVLVAWGPITHWYIALLGAIICAIAISGWIGELRHESKT